MYISRVVEGRELPPEKVDLYFEKGEATDPAIRMDGFDLLFSRNPNAEGSSGEDHSEDYRLYRSTSREVYGMMDYSRWDQFMGLLSKPLTGVIGNRTRDGTTEERECELRCRIRCDTYI